MSAQEFSRECSATYTSQGPYTYCHVKVDCSAEKAAMVDRIAELEAQCAAMREAIEKPLNYFDTALMCGNDLSDLAEPIRKALTFGEKK